MGFKWGVKSLGDFFLSWYHRINMTPTNISKQDIKRGNNRKAQSKWRKHTMEIYSKIMSNHPMKHGVYKESTECDGCYPKKKYRKGSIQGNTFMKKPQLLPPQTMIFRCVSKDKTMKGGRIMTSKYCEGFESLDNVGPVLLEYVDEDWVLCSDGCGVCKSDKVQEYWIPLFSNHSKNAWLKYTNWRTNKDFQGGDQITESTFRRFREWIRWKQGMTYEHLLAALPQFLMEDDFIKTHTTGKPAEMISTCLQELSRLNL